MGGLLLGTNLSFGADAKMLTDPEANTYFGLGYIINENSNLV